MRPKIYKGKCKVDWCDRDARAHGYCGRHYCQLYRLGKIKKQEDDIPGKPSWHAPLGELGALQKKLAEARHAYELASNLPARMKWREEITEIQEAINRLKEKRHDLEGKEGSDTKHLQIGSGTNHRGEDRPSN